MDGEEVCIASKDPPESDFNLFEPNLDEQDLFGDQETTKEEGKTEEEDESLEEVDIDPNLYV